MDNFTTLNASNASITGAADEIGGVLFPRVKLIHGADGTNDGDVCAGSPLPVVQTGALPAGSAAIGKLAANSGVDIGDVDVTSCALPTGAATSAKQDTGNTSLGNIDAKMVSGTDIGDVTINNAAGAAAVNIQDGGNTITVDGTVAVTNAGITSIDGKITACNTGAVVISSGSCTVDLGANNDVTVTNATAANCKVEATIVNGSINGAGAPTVDSYATAAVNVATGADSALVAAPGANKQIWVYGLTLISNVAGSFSLQDEDNTALSGVMPIDAKAGFVLNPCGNFAMPWIKVATNKALEIDCVTCEADGIITYGIISV